MLNLDFAKKITRKGKKRQKTNYGSHPIFVQIKACAVHKVQSLALAAEEILNFNILLLKIRGNMTF